MIDTVMMTKVQMRIDTLIDSIKNKDTSYTFEDFDNDMAKLQDIIHDACYWNILTPKQSENLNNLIMNKLVYTELNLKEV